MSVYGGPTNYWYDSIPNGQAITTPNGIDPKGLILNLDTSVSASYPGSGGTWTDISYRGISLTGASANISSTGVISGSAWTTGSTVPVLNIDTHSLFFMIRFNNTGTYTTGYSGSWDKILSFNAGGSDRTPSLWRFPSNRYIHWRYDPNNTGVNIGGTGSTGDTTPATEFTLNTWYYIGVVKSGASATVYVNASAYGPFTVSSPKTYGYAPLIIFEYYIAAATIQSIHIYNQAITSTDVTNNFNAIRSRFGL